MWRNATQRNAEMSKSQKSKGKQECFFIIAKTGCFLPSKWELFLIFLFAYFATIQPRYFTNPDKADPAKLWVTLTWLENNKLTQKLWMIVAENKNNNIKLNKQQNLEKWKLNTWCRTTTMTTSEKKEKTLLLFVTNSWLFFRNPSNKTSSSSFYHSVSYTDTHPAAMTHNI